MSLSAARMAVRGRAFRRPETYAAAHAPKGGVQIAGRFFAGGKFIPGEYLARATGAAKEKIKAGGQATAKAAQWAAKIPAKAEFWVTDRVPKPLRGPLGQIKRVYFASFTAASKTVDKLLADKPEPVRLAVTRVLAAADLAGTHLGTATAHGLGLAAPFTIAAGFVPLASLSYLAYSGARNPAATLKAARAAIRETIREIPRGAEMVRNAAEPADAKATLERLADAIGKRPNDWYQALLAVALDATHGNLEKAITAANAAYDKWIQSVK